MSRLFRLTLRDLFWLILFAAIAIGWIADRTAAAKTLRELNPSGTLSWLPSTSPTPAPYADLRQRLAEFSDAELLSEFRNYPLIDPARRDPDALYLLELSRRKMVEPLRAAYARVRNDPQDASRETADVLTALRRAEGKPDPLRPRAELVMLDEKEQPSDRATIRVWVENQDPEETVNLLFGCDYRSGRRERWRVELTAADGRRIPDAYYQNFIGGGLGSWKEIKPGAAGDERYLLDPRKYISPPPPGRYTLQVMHSNESIADQPDTTVSVVWKSDPLAVVVTNEIVGRPFSARTLAAVLGLGIVVAGVVATRGSAKGLRRRDWIYLILATTAATAWAWDQGVMVQRIEQNRPHTHATWTLHKDGEN